MGDGLSIVDKVVGSLLSPDDDKQNFRIVELSPADFEMVTDTGAAGEAVLLLTRNIMSMHSAR